MFCKECGTDVGDANACPNCGAAVAPARESANKNTLYDGPRVHKIAYMLIAIFLGTFGIHRFYAKRYLSGIVYILFCWTGIPSLLGLIEGIVAVCRQDEDAAGNIPIRDGFFI